MRLPMFLRLKSWSRDLLFFSVAALGAAGRAVLQLNTTDDELCERFLGNVFHNAEHSFMLVLGLS